MTDEMDNLNPYITKGNPPKKGDSSTMDKTIQVRVDSRTYNNLALSAANADKSISEYVRKIISDSIAN
jgi:predicted HicB family RNase H-like nuclease